MSLQKYKGDFKDKIEKYTECQRKKQKATSVAQEGVKVPTI